MQETFWTVIAGTLVFSLGKIFESAIINPLISYKKVIGEVTDQLILYAQAYSSKMVKEELHKEASDVFRKSAGRLQVYYNIIAWMRFLGFLWWLVPSRKDVNEATKSLIGLSNGIPPRDEDGRHNDRKVAIIREKLRIKFYEA
jgi:hypothetical protein